MDARSKRRVAVIEGYFSAIAAQDPERVATFYTDDYVLELPYHKPNEPLVVHGRETVVEYLELILARQRMKLQLSGVHAVPDEDLLIAEYSSEGEFTDTGAPYRNLYVGYFYFEGERLRRLREYYNPQSPGASAID